MYYGACPRCPLILRTYLGRETERERGGGVQRTAVAVFSAAVAVVGYIMVHISWFGLKNNITKKAIYISINKSTKPLFVGIYMLR